MANVQYRDSAAAACQAVHPRTPRRASSDAANLALVGQTPPHIKPRICAGLTGRRIVPSSSADRDTPRRNLLQKCRLVLGEDTQVEVEFVEKIPATPQGRFLRVVPQSEPPDGPGATAQGER
jgi:hypothetical protein